MHTNFSTFLIFRIDLNGVLNVLMVGVDSPECSIEQLCKPAADGVKEVAKPDNSGTLDPFKPACAVIDPVLDIHHQFHFYKDVGWRQEQAVALIVTDRSWHKPRFSDATAS